MSFLLRRTKRAVAGWYDSFDRPNEDPIQPPWQFWGDAASYALVGNRLRLAAEGAPARGGNANGGVAYEHQPLTENWGYEFVRAPIGNTSTSSTNETRQNIFMDKNWTEGVGASSTVYQVWLDLEADYEEDEDDEGNVSKKMTRYIRFRTREKTGSIWEIRSIGSDSVSLSATPWAAAVHIRVHVYEDRYMIGWINGSPELLLDVYDPNYRFGPRKRAANFAQVSGLVASIDEFKTYDLPGSPLRKSWVSTFFDDFERTNSTTVSNGWTQFSGGNFGIYQGALSMNSPFAGSDGYRQIRRDAGTGDVRLEFVCGGGTGDFNLTARSAILGRMTADGRQGIAARIHEQEIRINGFTWGGTATAPTFEGPTVLINNPFGTALVKGHKFSFNISGDYAWVRNETLDRLTYFRDGMNALASPSNTYVGAFITRYSFANSVPVNEIRVLV